MLSNNPAIYITMNSPQASYRISTTTLVNGIFYALRFIAIDQASFQNLSLLLQQIHSSYQIIRK